MKADQILAGSTLHRVYDNLLATLAKQIRVKRLLSYPQNLQNRLRLSHAAINLPRARIFLIPRSIWDSLSFELDLEIRNQKLGLFLIFANLVGHFDLYLIQPRDALRRAQLRNGQ